MNRNSAEGGIATVKAPRTTGRVQVTIEPGSPAPTGTGTLEGRVWGASGYESIYDANGSAINSIDLSARVTYTVDGSYRAIRVTSTDTDSDADAFDLIVSSIGA